MYSSMHNVRCSNMGLHMLLLLQDITCLCPQSELSLYDFCSLPSLHPSTVVFTLVFFEVMYTVHTYMYIDMLLIV